jgi:hypothetical protein
MMMLLSVNLYLKSGLKPVKLSETYLRRKIKQEHEEIFLYWWEKYNKSTDCEKWRPVSVMHQEFLSMNSIASSDYSVIRFSKALNEGAELYGYILEGEDRREFANNKCYRLIKPESDQ